MSGTRIILLENATRKQNICWFFCNLSASCGLREGLKSNTWIINAVQCHSSIAYQSHTLCFFQNIAKTRQQYSWHRNVTNTRYWWCSIWTLHVREGQFNLGPGIWMWFVHNSPKITTSNTHQWHLLEVGIDGETNSDWVEGRGWWWEGWTTREHAPSPK